MPFIVIHGTFHVVGKSPDGDSVNFLAKNLNLWGQLGGKRVKLHKDNTARLRFEGVDSLETHYTAGHRYKQCPLGKERHKQRSQPLGLGNAATDFVLKKLGIENVTRTDSGKTIKGADDETAGYILTRETDLYNRPVSFVFAGTTNLKDGVKVHLNISLLKRSVNFNLLEAGHAYPAYYKGLFYDLRNTMTEAVNQARSKNRGHWNNDKTMKGVKIGMRSIVSQPIMPKLFRRLVEYIECGQGQGATKVNFKVFLERKEDDIHILSKNHFTHFDTVVKIKNNKVSLIVPPEDLVFTPK